MCDLVCATNSAQAKAHSNNRLHFGLHSPIKIDSDNDTDDNDNNNKCYVMCIVFVMLLSYVVWIAHDCLNVVLCAAVVYYALCAHIVLHYVLQVRLMCLFIFMFVVVCFMRYHMLMHVI